MFFAFILIFIIGVGSLVALLMSSIPAVQRRLGENGSARIRIALGTALLGFVVVYMWFAFIFAAGDYGGFHYDASHRGHIWQGGRIVGDYVDEERLAALDDNEGALIRELWLKQITPLGLYQPCYTLDPALCALLKDEYATIPGWWLDSTWYLLVFMSAGAGLVAGALFYVRARRFTS
jgi:hypothetical protein